MTRAKADAVFANVLPDVYGSSVRDPYIFNLFEVLLTTLETKLRRVENMDRALERLVRRLDTMETRLAINLNTTSQMAHLLENRLLDPSIFRNNNGRSTTGGSRQNGEISEEALSNSLMEQRLFLLTEHVSRIEKKLSSMQKAWDSNSIALAQDELVASASENYRVGVPRVQALDKNPDLSQLQESVESVMDSVTSMDRRLQFHMAYVSGDLERLSESVKDIHTAILEDQTPATNKPKELSRNTSVEVAPRRTKIDSLVDRMSPMETVWEKMEEVWDVVVGTKSSVDVLVPKSEELLNTSQRQERAISTIQYDLTEKANHIIQNLVEVERTLKTMPRESKSSRDHINPVSLLHRSTQGHHVQDDTPADDPPGDLVDQTFLLEHNTNESFPTTERPSQRNPVGPSGLVFPSVQKKPDILNSTFMVNNMHDQNLEQQGYSCSDLSKRGMSESGTYYLKIRGTTYWFLRVYCDMNTIGGGWTVIQRRDDFGEPRETFNREWDDYKHGFGNPEAEFWLGNENIYMLTNTDDYMLRVELEDFDGNRRYAEYSTFKLHSEQDMYKLEIGGYSGNAGDSLNDPWYGSNLSPFSTVNRDADDIVLTKRQMAQYWTFGE
ncbi:Fibrinogen-related domains (FReDs) [Halocaridina rubra]|uniref:Fibrinogen-related domains (FReDs) n=1 Tax=Halocaridina rubra TaxID=373956 RepID=A0AAN9AEQ3_HALRR